MSLVFKNSAASTQQKPVVNIEGEDYPVNELVAIAQEAGRVRTTSSHEETLAPYVAPAPAAAKPALVTPT